MKASIVVRTFNCEGTIGNVLDGVSDQLFDGYELVIVDSGSTDGTLDIVGKYPHTLVDYSGKKFTYGGSLNAGISAARGEYIVCLSHHCVPLHQYWLGSLVATLDGDDRLAGAWGPLVFDVDGYPVGNKAVDVIDLDTFHRRPNWGLQNPNSIIRRDLWEERPFSEDLERCEDQDWILHFLERGYLSAMVQEAAVLYAPEFGFFQYAVSNYKNSLALDEMFDYRNWGVSTAGLIRQSIRQTGAAVLGKKTTRVSRLAISSMIGRWAADKAVRHREDPVRLYRSEAAEMAQLTLGVASAARGGARRLRTSLSNRRNGFRSGLPRSVQRVQFQKGQQPGAVRTGLKTRFFLVGEMRSGTSWLQKTLDSHPEVLCKGEGSFFGRDQATEEIPVYKGPTPSLYNALLGCESVRTWHSLMWNGWGKGDVEEDLRNITRLSMNYYFAKEAAASGKRIVGDKSPLHTDHVDEIHDFYPEARTIHIYRDGRDVAVSLMHHFWRMAEDKGGIFELEPEELSKRDAYLADPEGFLASGESIFTEERLGQMAVRWSRRVSKASREGAELFGDKYVQIRYEDLLENPEEHLKGLFLLLGARADDETVKKCVEQNRFEKLARRAAGQEDSGSFFRKGVAGDWRSVFTQRDREIYEGIAGDTLETMGYPVG